MPLPVVYTHLLHSKTRLHCLAKKCWVVEPDLVFAHWQMMKAKQQLKRLHVGPKAKCRLMSSANVSQSKNYNAADYTIH